jgi:heme exporter protein A
MSDQDNCPGGLGIKFHNIEKRYGARFALRRVSLEIVAGECVALIGANGSGKTTLLKIAALLVRPNTGTVAFVDGKSQRAAGGSATEIALSPENAIAVKHRIGLLSHNILVYDELTAEENLVLFARLYGLDHPHERAAAALEPTGLIRRRADLVRTFSRGMRQRLAIARAILAAPELLLLDEPAAGLDPAGQHWLGVTLARLRGEGCTVVMSTHGPSETHTLVTRVVRLVNGEIVEDSGASGDPRGMLSAMLAARQEA